MLPLLLSWRGVVKALVEAGFRSVGRKGSHVILIKNNYHHSCPKTQRDGKRPTRNNRGRWFNKRGIELVFLKEGVEVYVRSRLVKEWKAIVKILGNSVVKGAFLPFTPRKF
ncbi:MAG: type II toxin-antitoxin system HicA family toxin [Thermoproteota archaeon]